MSGHPRVIKAPERRLWLAANALLEATESSAVASYGSWTGWIGQDTDALLALELRKALELPIPDELQRLRNALVRDAAVPEHRPGRAL